MEIKLTTGDAADAMDKVVTGEADLAIAGAGKRYPARGVSMLENLAVVRNRPGAAPLRCVIRFRLMPDWSTVPFIMADQGPVRRIELWFLPP